jgi:hypothetical protein
MDVNQFKIKLQELESNLENTKVQEVLQHENFSLSKLKESIINYLDNIEQITDDNLLKTIDKKVDELIAQSNKRAFSNYSHEFVNAANFLIKSTPLKSTNIDNDFIALDGIKISENEFSKRYDKLIDSLNFEGEEANLILETPSEKKPFRVYKTKTKSLAIYANSSKEPMTIGADRLLEVAFKRKEPSYTSYEIVLISKIFDNSIFDFFKESVQQDLIEVMKNKLLKNENDLLIFKDELEKVQKDNQELLDAKQQLSEIVADSKNAMQEYIFAKEAAINDTKLKASVTYWDAKKDKHQILFRIYMGIAIGAIAILIGVLFYFVSNHKSQMNIGNNIEMISKILDDNKTKSEVKEITPKLNQVRENNFFDYSKLAWYALMIFASSSAFWIIRITVKIALSNLHLSEDAHERVVMIQTYLSFIQEGHGLDEKDKQLILSSLFRSSNIGIIQDESSVTVADIVTAFKK